jgi:hypothetical protein
VARNERFIRAILTILFFEGLAFMTDRRAEAKGIRRCWSLDHISES